MRRRRERGEERIGERGEERGERGEGRGERGEGERYCIPARRPTGKTDRSRRGSFLVDRVLL